VIARATGRLPSGAASRATRWVCATVLLAAVGGTATSVDAHDRVALPPRDIGVVERLDAHLPLDVPLRDERGAPTTLALLLAGRPAVITLTRYGCAHLCPVMLEGLTRVLRDMPLVLGRDYVVITLSFDPGEGPAAAAERKAQVVRSYLPAARSGGWHFLTGGEDAVGRIAHALGFRYPSGPARNVAVHPTGFAVLTPTGSIARYLFTAEEAARDLRLALVDAGHGATGSLAEHAGPTCHPAAAIMPSHAPAVIAAVRAASALSLIGMGSLFVVMLRAERTRGRRAAHEASEGASRAA
jgi:protein SCO1